MNVFQKVIKYCAMAFGIFLAINIIGAIVLGVTMLLSVLCGFDLAEEQNAQEIVFTQQYEGIDSIYIELTNTKLNIKKGKTLKLEAYGKSNEFDIKKINSELKIKDNDNNNWFNKNKDLEITIYIPNDIELEKADIKLDINTANIEYLNAKDLRLDLGVGKFDISNIKADSTKIETGLGKTSITESELNNLDLNTGIGKTTIDGISVGNCNIETGIGKTDIKIIGNKEEYKIISDVGIGSIIVNNEKVKNNETIGNGINLIKVTGRYRSN